MGKSGRNGESVDHYLGLSAIRYSLAPNGISWEAIGKMNDGSDRMNGYNNIDE